MRKLLALAIAAVLATAAYAAVPNPGHPASSIGPGTFSAGNYVFPAELDVTGNLVIDTSSLFVNATSGYIGLNTTAPNNTLELLGTANFTGPFTENGDLKVYNTSGKRMFFVNSSSNIIRYGDVNSNVTILVNGTINATGNITAQSGFDLAEVFSATEDMSPGDLVAIAGPNTVKKATKADADLVLGAVSTSPGFIMASSSLASPVMIGLAGRIPVKVTGTVQAGDFITISNTPGVGERATTAGFVIGRAIENGNNGVVNIIIQPYYFNPAVNSDGTIVGGSSTKKLFIDESAVAKAVKIAAPQSFAQSNETNVTAPGVQTDVISPQSGKDVVIQIG